MREVDTVARLGGDEFAVLLNDIKSGGEACQVAKKLLQVIESPFSLTAGTTVRISASIGIAVYTDRAESAESLLSRADNAMYEAKKTGRKLECLRDASG